MLFKKAKVAGLLKSKIRMWCDVGRATRTSRFSVMVLRPVRRPVVPVRVRSEKGENSERTDVGNVVHFAWY